MNTEEKALWLAGIYIAVAAGKDLEFNIGPEDDPEWVESYGYPDIHSLEWMWRVKPE